MGQYLILTVTIAKPSLLSGKQLATFSKKALLSANYFHQKLLSSNYFRQNAATFSKIIHLLSAK
jgi:hypothetical protein